MFSRIVGLKEHPGKTQLVASSAASRRHLEAHLNTAAPELLERVVDSAVVLGAVSMQSGGRGLRSKELERLEASASIARRIGLLPGTRAFRLQMLRMYALPKAAYGWVARSPTKAACDKLDAVVHTGGRGFKRSPKAMRQLLEGASLALAAVIGVRQVTLWRRRLLTEAPPVQPDGSSRLQQQATSWLTKAGWLPWHHHGIGSALPHEAQWSSALRGRLAHALRESWRWGRFHEFLESGHHIVADMQEEQYVPAHDYSQESILRLLGSPA